MSNAGQDAPQMRRVWTAAFALGFAIGGFFDGILLHQILQWHHLLSGLDGGPGLRGQILADGLFHLAMYGVGAIGLALLWQARSHLDGPMAGRTALSGGLIGFGTWHILDGILSHWLIGLHRIRMDTAAPLAWDLLWFFAFGIGFVAAGLWVARKRRSLPAHTTSILIAAVMIGTAILNAFPVVSRADGAMRVAVLMPGVPAGRALERLVEVGARLISSNAEDTVWVIAVGEDFDPATLYRHGLVSGGGILSAGCLDWTVPDRAAAAI